MNVLKEDTDEETIDTIAQLSNNIQNILYQFNIIEKTNGNLDKNLQSQIEVIKKQVSSLKDDVHKIRNLVVNDS